MEARVYAEDAFRDFLPQAGIAEYVKWPAHARVDAALASGQSVGTNYDPMLGKVIVHGATRETARRALIEALDDTAILGLTTNVGFLRALAASDAFRDATVDTAWLDRNPGFVIPAGGETAAVLGAWALAQETATVPDHPFGVSDGWRMAAPAAPIKVELVVDGHTQVFSVFVDGQVRCGAQGWFVQPIHAAGPVLKAEVDGHVREGCVRISAHRVEVSHLGHTFSFPRPDYFAPGGHNAESDGAVVAPMPGVLLRVLVSVGDRVNRGDVLGLLEAMKMETPLRAPHSGTVSRVPAIATEQVQLGAVLFVVDAQQSAEVVP